MKYLTPYRIAAGILVLFCLGHTAGGMLAQKSLGAESDTVFDAMKAVHFNFNGASCTWYGFWFAFGLTASIFLLLSALLAWKLDKVAAENWPVVSTIAWMLLACHVANAALSWAYFFTGAGILATIVAILLAVGALQKQSQLQAPSR